MSTKRSNTPGRSQTDYLARIDAAIRDAVGAHRAAEGWLNEIHAARLSGELPGQDRLIMAQRDLALASEALSRAALDLVAAIAKRERHK